MDGKAVNFKANIERSDWKVIQVISSLSFQNTLCPGPRGSYAYLEEHDQEANVFKASMRTVGPAAAWPHCYFSLPTMLV